MLPNLNFYFVSIPNIKDDCFLITSGNSNATAYSCLSEILLRWLLKLLTCIIPFCLNIKKETITYFVLQWYYISCTSCFERLGACPDALNCPLENDQSILWIKLKTLILEPKLLCKVGPLYINKYWNMFQQNLNMD
jgi:hypothetical protein